MVYAIILAFVFLGAVVVAVSLTVRSKRRAKAAVIATPYLSEAAKAKLQKAEEKRKRKEERNRRTLVSESVTAAEVQASDRQKAEIAAEEAERRKVAKREEEEGLCRERSKQQIARVSKDVDLQRKCKLIALHDRLCGEQSRAIITPWEKGLWPRRKSNLSFDAFLAASVDYVCEGRRDNAIVFDPQGGLKRFEYRESVDRISDELKDTTWGLGGLAIYTYCDNGSFSEIHDEDFIPKRGEKLYFSCPKIALWEPRSVRTSYTEGLGSSYGNGWGLRTSSHESWTTSVSHDELTLIARGKVFVSDKRVLFVGENNVRDVKFSDLVSFKSNWRNDAQGQVELASQKRSKTMIFEGYGMFDISVLVRFFTDKDFAVKFMAARAEFSGMDFARPIPDNGSIMGLHRMLQSLPRT